MGKDIEKCIERYDDFEKLMVVVGMADRCEVKVTEEVRYFHFHCFIRGECVVAWWVALVNNLAEMFDPPFPYSLSLFLPWFYTWFLNPKQYKRREISLFFLNFQFLSIFPYPPTGAKIFTVGGWTGWEEKEVRGVASFFSGGGG